MRQNRLDGKLHHADGKQQHHLDRQNFNISSDKNDRKAAQTAFEGVPESNDGTGGQWIPEPQTVSFVNHKCQLTAKIIIFN